MLAKPWVYQSLILPCHLSFSGLTSSNLVAANPTLGLGKLLITTADFLDMELDFAETLEGWSGAEDGGKEELGDPPDRMVEMAAMVRSSGLGS